jgi:hypothetical protein
MLKPSCRSIYNRQAGGLRTEPVTQRGKTLEYQGDLTLALATANPLLDHKTWLGTRPHDRYPPSYSNERQKLTMLLGKGKVHHAGDREKIAPFPNTHLDAGNPLEPEPPTHILETYVVQL